MGQSNIENRFEKVLTLRDVQNIDFSLSRKKNKTCLINAEKKKIFYFVC